MLPKSVWQKKYGDMNYAGAHERTARHTHSPRALVVMCFTEDPQAWVALDPVGTRRDYGARNMIIKKPSTIKKYTAPELEALTITYTRATREGLPGTPLRDWIS